MNSIVGKPLLKKYMTSKKTKVSGFTLLELIIVIIILGVMSVGIASFIKLSTQTYLNVNERDELLSSARFAVERLNREVRNAVPNSVRINSNATTECLEFIPIKASTTYIDIPVIPEPASKNIEAIPFQDVSGNTYQCSFFCLDKVTVYPLDNTDVYADTSQIVGNTFDVQRVNVVNANEWQLQLKGFNNINFAADSPTQRLYIFQSPVSYCLRDDKLFRFEGYTVSDAGYVIPPAFPILMAEYLSVDAVGSSFSFLPATLQRNAIVQTNLHFIRNDEENIFNNDIHINNIP